jgi:hypothetical protein
MLAGAAETFVKLKTAELLSPLTLAVTE